MMEAYEAPWIEDLIADIYCGDPEDSTEVRDPVQDDSGNNFDPINQG